MDAAVRDALTGIHYRGIDLPSMKPARLERSMKAYVSYRKSGLIYWTSRPVTIGAGETILANDRDAIRGRCGNRISSTPRQPVMTDPAAEPSPEVLGTPQVNGAIVGESMRLLIDDPFDPSIALSLPGVSLPPVTVAAAGRPPLAAPPMPLPPTPGSSDPFIDLPTLSPGVNPRPEGPLFPLATLAPSVPPLPPAVLISLNSLLPFPAPFTTVNLTSPTLSLAISDPPFVYTVLLPTPQPIPHRVSLLNPPPSLPDPATPLPDPASVVTALPPGPPPSVVFPPGLLCCQLPAPRLPASQPSQATPEPGGCALCAAALMLLLLGRQRTRN